jgi:hypothetical protein
MAYDPSHQQTVLVGGCCTTFFGYSYPWGDTWLWNGTNWSQATGLSSAPSSRFGASLTYDPAANGGSGGLLLFGGYVPDTSSYFGVAAVQDTWLWNGSGWTQLTPSGTLPATRGAEGLVYDSFAGAPLLFAGAGIGLGGYADLWEWKGNSWTSVTSLTANPPGRDELGMAYDGSRNEAVVFAGVGAAGILGDTWTNPESAPRTAAALAQFSFSAAGATAPTLQQVTITASAGAAAGSTTGAQLAAWDDTTGAWKQLASNSNGVGSPGALTYASASAAEASRYLDGANGNINLSLRAPTVTGDASTAASVAVDYVELDVAYTQCPSGQSACGAACVNLTSSASNCGACGVTCPTGISCSHGQCACPGGEEVINGRCQCPSGETLCGGSCVNTATDPSNCGGCGNVCSTGYPVCGEVVNSSIYCCPVDYPVWCGAASVASNLCFLESTDCTTVTQCPNGQWYNCDYGYKFDCGQLACVHK